MDARPRTVTDILQTGTDQYLIPFFQRHYKWTKREWDRLWQDAVRLLDFPDKDRHFLGSMVCTPHHHVPGDVTSYLLIDGQQRITTLTILLTALKNKAAELEMDQIVEQIHECFLVHKWQKGTNHYRVVPRTGDREVLFGIIEGIPPKTVGANRIKNALKYFERMIEAHLADQDNQQTALRNLFSLVTSRLSLVVITIDDENPYEIFWSLNGKGLPLRQSDLIRNFVFMQVPLKNQEDFNKTHWDHLENLLEETDDGKSNIDATRFYRNFLMRNGVYIRKENTFLEFRSQYDLHQSTPGDVADELTRFAEYYRRTLDPDLNDDPQLEESLSRLRQLDQATCHPLVMNLIARCEADEMTRESLLACLGDLQSFILRRSICGESTRGYGKLFVEATTNLAPDPEANLKEFLLAKQWPDDAAFVPSLVSYDLYRRERKMTALILATVEKSYGSKEAVALGKGITIEHVMPQTITSGADAKSWQDTLGTDWQNTHRKHVDSLGNLSLTGYNSELSNSSFTKKKELFAASNLLLNRYFEEADTWDPAAIEIRGQQLAQETAAIWPRPAGKPYVPTQKFSQEQKLLMAEFWTEFLNLREETHRDQKRPKQLARNYISFRSARYRVWYYVEVHPDDDAACVGVFCRGHAGNKFVEALWDDIPDALLEDLDEQLGTQYDFDQPGDEGGFSEIYLEKTDLSFDRSTWPGLHEWLVKALDDFQNRLEPIVLEVDLDSYIQDEAEDEMDDEIDDAERDDRAVNLDELETE